MEENKKAGLNLIKKYLPKVAKLLDRTNLATYAASTSFFFFLSMIPMIILLCTIVPFTPIDMDYVIATVNKLLPGTVKPIIISAIRQIYSSGAGTITVSLVISLWSAGTGMNEIIKAINHIHDYKEHRNYLYLRIYSSIATLVLVFVMVFSLVGLVFGRNLVTYFLFKPELMEIYTAVKRVIHLQYLIVFVLLVVVFTLMYSKMPAERTSFKSNVFGALFCSLAWLIFTGLFSMFLRIYNPFTAYGSLATTVIIMIWIYSCMYCMILGAIINGIRNKTLIGMD